MQTEVTAKDYLGADDIKSYVSGVDPDYTVLFVDETTANLTLGKLVARLLKNSLTEKETKIFWVDLKNKNNYYSNYNNYNNDNNYNNRK